MAYQGFASGIFKYNLSVIYLYIYIKSVILLMFSNYNFI